jgi:hypothetical protein
MDINECALNLQSKQYRLTLNQNLSNILMKKNLLKVEIGEDDITGDIHLLFSQNKGRRLICSGRGKINLYIGYNKWMTILAERLCLEEGKRYILKLSNNKSIREDVIYVQIIK